MEGQFSNGIPANNAFFRVRYPNGEVYEGNINRNKRHGFGKYYYNNGDIYDGGWERNKKSGKGRFYVKSLRAEINGDFEDDEIVKGNLKDRMNNVYTP